MVVTRLRLVIEGIVPLKYRQVKTPAWLLPCRGRGLKRMGQKTTKLPVADALQLELMRRGLQKDCDNRTMNKYACNKFQSCRSVREYVCSRT